MRVLLATDGSASATVAAQLVGNIRWPIGTSIQLVRVVGEGGEDVVGGPWLAGPMVLPDVRASEIQNADAALVAVAAPLQALGLKTARAVFRGLPADALLEWTDRHQPDLIFVGDRGLSPIKRALLGSVSAALVDRSPVPVIVARRPTLERVVVAVDGSDIADQVLAAIRRWPFLATTEIRTLSIAAADARFEHETIAMEAAAILRSAGLIAHPEVRTGSPGPTIVDFAREWDADLVIMGSHGRTGLARLLLGSVARSVLHQARCSVLVVRRHADPVRRVQVEATASAWTLVSTH
jgi:nucleotide-binding universal stress UspA family protein